MASISIASLVSAEVAEILEEDVVMPLLKKTSLDVSDLTNYGLVSNILVSGKVLECRGLAALRFSG